MEKEQCLYQARLKVGRSFGGIMATYSVKRYVMAVLSGVAKMLYTATYEGLYSPADAQL